MSNNILFVHPSPEIVPLVNLLEREGHAVLQAPGAAAALNAAATFHPDIILLYAANSGVELLDACRRLTTHSATADVAVLMVWPKKNASSIPDGFRAGAADYLLEPYEHAEVLARVKTHLQLRSLKLELRACMAQLASAGPRAPAETPDNPPEPRPRITLPREESAGAPPLELPLNLQKTEALLIDRALSETGGNVARAARLLGINRSRIYRKFREKLT